MSETHVNAYRLILAEKQAELAVLKGEINALERKVSSMEPADPVTNESTASDKTEKDEAKK